MARLESAGLVRLQNPTGFERIYFVYDSYRRCFKVRIGLRLGNLDTNAAVKSIEM